MKDFIKEMFFHVTPPIVDTIIGIVLTIFILFCMFSPIILNPNFSTDCIFDRNFIYRCK